MLKKTTLVVMLISMLLPFQPALAQNTNGDLDGALNWLESQLQEDGGFSNGFAPESDVGATADAVLAIALAGKNPVEVLTSAGNSPIDFLREWVNSDQEAGAGKAAKITIALEAAGIAPATFAERDLIQLILGDYDSDTGLFGLGPFDSGLAILALVASGNQIPEGAIEALLGTRLEDGSFAFSYDPSLVTGDSNTTAIVVQALISADMGAQIGESIAYFRNTQNEDSGWTYQKPSEFGEETDANSTALVIQALRAAGEDIERWGDPMHVLVALQEPSGAFAFSSTFSGDNILATLQAIPTLAGADYTNLIPIVESDSNNRNLIIAAVLILIILVLGTVVVVNRKVP